MERTNDPGDLRNARELLGDVHGFNPDELVEPPNVVLKDGDNLGLFEYCRPGVYSGHYLFRNGNSYDIAKAMLDEMFSLGAVVIQGATPVDNLAALRLTRRLGFTSHGVTETPAGPMEIFTLTKDQL